MYLDVKEIIKSEFGETFFKEFCGKDYYYFVKLSDILEEKIPSELTREYENTNEAFITYHSLMFEHFQEYFFTALQNIFNPNV